MDITLKRGPSAAFGTFGLLILPDQSEYHTLELPWRGNEQRRSCIPFGSYHCAIVRSPKFGSVYEVMGVPGRNAILIHAGNHAGDVSMGLRSDVEGCILVGLNRGLISNQPAVTSSRAALGDFMERLAGAEFRLDISSS